MRRMQKAPLIVLARMLRFVGRFNAAINNFEEHMQSIEVPDLVSEANNDRPSSTVDVSSAYLAQCVFEESLSYLFYASERKYWQNVIVQSNIYCF